MRAATPPARSLRPLLFATAFSAVAFAFLLQAGCGGGGGSSKTSTTVDPGTPVGTLSGYVYVPADAVLAPGRAAQEDPARETAAVALAVPSAVLRAAPSGYIPLSGAVVQLSGTTKATITSTSGYFSFTITDTDRISGYAKVSVTKPEANITLEFETQVYNGMNKTVQLELSTQTGTTLVKELAGSAPDADFVYITGRTTTSLGVSLSGVGVSAALTSDPAVQRFTVTDALGFYRFTGLTDGVWRITAAKAGFRSVEQTVNISSEYTLTNINFSLSGTFDITEILATRLTENSVTLEFLSSVPAVAQVEYGLTPAYGASTAFELSYVNTHAVSISGLSRNTEYFYRIKAKDTNDNQVLSQGSSFRTTDGTVQDSTPPEINTYTVTKTHNSFKVVFTLSKVSYGRIEYGLSRAAMTQTTLRGPSTTITIQIDNLQPATTYYIDLLGVNTFDTSQITRVALDPVVTDATPDTTAPLLANARVTELKPTSVKIAWETAGELSNSQIYFDTVPGSPAKTIQAYSKSTALYDENPLVAAHEVPITGLEIEKTYYARPVSRDPAGNAGISAAEVVFTTPKPGTAITLARTIENPPAGTLAVGESFRALSLKATGSSTEAVALTRLSFRNTGTAVGADFESVRLLRADALPVTATISGGAFILDLSSSTIEIAASGESYFDIEVLMRSSALGKTVLLDLQDATRVTATGRTYGRAATPANAFPLGSETFTVRKASLTLATAGATTETTLNTGINNIALLSFTLSSLYEDAYVQKIQVWQTGTAQMSDQPYVNVRLYRGTDSLVSAPAGERMDFLASGSAGLFTVPKGGAQTLSVVADIPPGAITGKSIQLLVQVVSVTATGRFSFLAADVGGEDARGSKYTLGQSSLTVSRATADPTPQTFVQGDTQKDLFVFAITAGGAEDVNVTSVKITQGGTAASGEVTDFHLVSDNQTKASAAFTAPSTTFANASGLLFVPKGQTKIVHVVGNINTTAGKTIQLGVVASGDVQGRGADTLTTKDSEGNATGSSHIVVGKLQALSAVTPSGALVLAAQDRPLFSFQMKSVGEAVNYRKIYVRLIGDTRIVSNLELTDGTTVYTNPETTNLGYAFNVDGATSSSDGLPVTFALSGDVAAVTSYVGQKVRYYVDHGAAVATGALSLNQFNSINRVDGNELTVTLGSLAIGTAASVVPPSMAVAGTLAAEIVGGFTLTAGVAEAVKISKIVVNELNGSVLYGTDFDELQLFDGVTSLGFAQRSGGNYEFPLATALDLAASSAKTFTLTAKIPSAARSGLTARFGVRNGTYVTVTGALSGIALAPTGSALSPAFTIRAGAMQALPHSSNPPETSYPKTTAAEVEFLRFKVAVDAVEGIKLARAAFVRTSNTILKADSFALRLYDANGIWTAKEWSGSDVVVEGPNITFDLASPALTLPSGTTDVELRLYAKFDTNAVVPGNAETVNLASGGLTGTSTLSLRDVVASGTVTGNAMRISDVADALDPVISAIAASGMTQTGATIAWTTDEPASSKVFYRILVTDPWMETGEFDTGTRTTAHTVTLSGLAAGTTYRYMVRSVDAAGNDAESAGTDTFATLPVLSGKLTAALSTATPAAANVPANTTTEFLKVTLQAASDGSNDEDVKVSSIKFTLSGASTTVPDVATDATSAHLGALTLSDGAVAYTASLSGSTVTFASATPGLPLYTVRRKDAFGNAATVTLTLSGPSNTSAAGRKARFRIDAAGDIAATGAVSGATLTAAGTFAVTGNTMTFTSGNLALTQVAAPVSGTTVLPGRANYDLLSFTVTAGANEKVDLTKITVTTGADHTASFTGDLTNYRLMNGTTTLASATVVGSTLVFGKTTPLLRIDESTSKTLVVRADVSFGATAGRVVELQVEPTAILGKGVTTAIELSCAVADPTVAGSTITVGSSALEAAVNASSPASTSFLPGSSSGKTFAKFDVKIGSAESLTVSSILFTVGGSLTPGTDLSNLTLHDGSASHTLAYQSSPAGYKTTTGIALPANSTVTFTVSGNVIGTTGGANFYFELQPGALVATGAVTGQRLSTGTATAARHYIVGDLTLAADGYMPQQATENYVAGNPAVLPFWSGTITSRTEAVKISSLSLTLDGNGANLTDVTLRDRTNNVSYINPVFSAGRYVFTTASPQQLQLSAGASANFTLYGKIPVTATVGQTVKVSLMASGVAADGAVSEQPVKVSGDLVGNALELRKGTMSLALDVDSPVTPSGILIGGTDKAETWFRLTAASVEAILLKTVTVSEIASSRDPQDIKNVNLYFGADPLPAAGTTTKTYNETTRAYTFSDIQSSAGAAVRVNTGETLLFKVKADAGDSVEPGKQVRFRANAGAVTGRGAASAATLASTETNVASTGAAEGQGQVLVAGKMRVETDVNGVLNPSFQAAYNDFIEVGSTGVKLFRFTVRGGDAAGASLEDITLSSVKIRISGAETYFQTLSLYDDTDALLKSVAPTSNEPVFDGLSFPLVKGTARAFTLRGDIKSTAVANTSVTFSIDSAGAVAGTGATSAKAIVSTGAASYYIYTYKTRSLAVSAPAVQVSGQPEWKPGEEKDALAFRLAAGPYEALTSLQVKVSKSGTLADSLLEAALYDGTTKIAPPAPDNYMTFSGGSVTFAPGTAHTLAAGSIKSYTVKAKPALTAPDAATFTLSVAASGDVSALGVFSPGRSVSSTGTVSGEAHTTKRTGMTLSRNASTAAGNLTLPKDTVFEALRFDIATDGTNMVPVMFTSLKVTNVGVDINTNQKWEIQGLYEADGTTLFAGPAAWNCQGAAPTWTTVAPGGIELAPAGIPTVKTLVLKVKAKTTALAGDQIEAQISAANLTAIEQGGGAIVVVGTATGNTFKVKSATLTFAALDAELKRGYSGAAGKDYFLVGNAPAAVNQMYAVGVFKITNDNQENVTVTHLEFTYSGSASYGNGSTGEFNNPRVYLLGNGGGVAQINTNGSVVTNAANVNLTYGAPVIASGGGRITVTLDSNAGTPAAADALTIASGGSATVALLVDFPTTGGKSTTVQFSLAGITATGASSLATIATPAQVACRSLDIVKSLKVSPSTSSPAAFTAQVPFTGGHDNYQYRILRFKLENLGSAAATISTGKLRYSGTANIDNLDNPGVSNIDVRIYNSSGGSPGAAFDDVDYATRDATTINFTIPATLTIAAGDYVEIVARCYVRPTASADEGETIVFSVPQSGWAGADTDGETLTSYSDATVANAAHTLGDSLLVTSGGNAVAATIEAFLSNNTNNRSKVFSFTVANKGQDAVNIDSALISEDLGFATYVSAPYTGNGELWNLGWVTVNNGGAVQLVGTGTWTYTAPVVAVAANGSAVFDFAVKRAELRWGTGTTRPANWPADTAWPYQAPFTWDGTPGACPDSTGTWGATWISTYPTQGFSAGERHTTPNPDKVVHFKVEDDDVLAESSDTLKDLRSDGEAESGYYNFKITAEVEVSTP